MPGALTPLQTAVYQRLSSDATLVALATGGIWGDVPEQQAFPHVRVGNATLRPWNTFGGAEVGIGWNATITVHIFSRFQGDDEAAGILDRVIALLHFAALTVTGYTTVMCELDQSRMLVEQIDKLEARHGVAVFRVRIS